MLVRRFHRLFNGLLTCLFHKMVAVGVRISRRKHCLIRDSGHDMVMLESRSKLNVLLGERYLLEQQQIYSCSLGFFL